MGAKKPVATASKKRKSVPKPAAIPSPEPAEKDVGGRPPIEYTDEKHGQVESMLGYGLTMEQAAHVVGMSKTTLERKLKARSEAQGFDALEHARAKVLANLTQSAYSQAMPTTRRVIDGKGRYVTIDVPPNARMTQFLLNVLGGNTYVPRRAIELGGPDGGKFELVVTDYRGKKP